MPHMAVAWGGARAYVAFLYLQRGMRDREVMTQFFVRRAQKGVAWMSCGHDKMRAERR